MTTIRDQLRAQIAALRTPAQRRAFAVELRALADELEDVAAAQHRQRQRPAAQRLTPKPRHGGGRRPARFVWIAREVTTRGYARVQIKIGRGLYYDLGSPARVDMQVIDGALWLRPAHGDVGYALNISGIPRFHGATDVLDAFEDGCYSADVRAGAIVVGARKGEQ